MDHLILAAEACDVEGEIICAPANVNELFEFKDALFSIGGFDFTRTVFLIFLAAAIVIALMYFGLRGGKLVPSKFGTAIESVAGFIRDDVAVGIIGPEGARYFPYLLALFMFILVGNLFEVTPFVNFPVTSRMALPASMALMTWFIFVTVGVVKNGPVGYFGAIMWPKSVPIGFRWFVGIIELVSTLLLRPITLAVRLFANLVAGHLMLTLLLGSGWIFISNIGNIGAKAATGVVWFAIGLGIFLFEIVVSVLQAYIFTLLSAVYVQSSLHPEH